MTTGRRIQIIVGLFLSLGVALMPLGAWGKAYSGLDKLLGNEVLWWVAVIVILLYVAFVERRPFPSIGFRTPGILDIGLAIGAGILLVAGIIVIYGFVFPALHLKMNAGAMNTIIQTPFWYRFILVTRAALAEETLFRAYPIERIGELTGSTVIAALISWAAFTYAHLSSWGAAQLIVAGYGGIILTGLYLWRRNIWANMIAHWIADGSGFLFFHR